VCLVAGIHIFDHTKADINYGAAAGGLSVNLWHGIPLKRIGDDILSPRHAHQIARRERGLQRAWQRLRRPALFEAYDYTISTSPSATQRLSSALSLPPSHVAVTGYPRNDVLRPSVRTILTAQERNIAANLRATADLGERVVLYAPTFRERAEGEAPSSHLNVRSLDDVLTRHRCRMYVKLHPNDRSDLLSRDRYGRIDVITGRIDIYPLLHFFDALITDYSSIYHDYLLLDRPLLFYPYDLEQYARVTHGLYDSYNSVTPGPQARNAQELSHALDKLLGDFDAQSAQWASQRESVRRRFHEFDDQGSAQRVLEFLLSLDPAGPHRSRPSEKRVRRRNGENE
jgi:CDP-glycerol glycerophosphotransferase (TagB/SpsB family)